MMSSHPSSTDFVTQTFWERCRSLAFELGFDHLAVTKPVLPDVHRESYLKMRESGVLASLPYLVREPEKRLDPAKIFPHVRSILTIGVSYYQGPVPSKPGAGYGRVARYAWGLDYHDVITARLGKFLEELSRELGRPLKSVVAVDTKPLLERALAESSGLGFIGKNTLLIVPRTSPHRTGFHVGSFVFLAEILLDVDLNEEDDIPVKKTGCGSCEKCLVACPTQAFEGPYKLKTDRCISYLTIENKGAIVRSLRPLLGDWIFGCDVCQDVCPFNTRAFETRWSEFHPQSGVGPWVSLSEILQIRTEPEFKAKFGRTPLSRAKRTGLIRNACVVAGNSGDESLVSSLSPLLKEPSPILRSHALWALSRLTPPHRARQLADESLRCESDPSVQEEARAILESCS